jgi:hypothetical protein
LEDGHDIFKGVMNRANSVGKDKEIQSELAWGVLHAVSFKRRWAISED